MTVEQQQNPTVALDEQVALVSAYQNAQAEADRWKKAADLLKGRLREAMGDATEATVGGQPAFTYRRTGQFSKDRFYEEQPALAAAFTRPVTRDELDEDALKKAHPATYTAYRARRFVRAG